MLVLLALLPGLTARGQTAVAPNKSPAPPPFVCSNETLNGRFATRGSGLAQKNWLGPGEPLFPFANVSLMTFDGAGGLTSAGVSSRDGWSFRESGSGTYELKADCTGEMIVGGFFFYLVVAERGTQFYMISMDLSVLTVEGRRVQ